MAGQNSIDFESINQQITEEVYQGFKSAMPLWYLKNASLKMIDASSAFMETFIPPGIDANCSLERLSRKIFTPEQRATITSFEHEVLSLNEARTYITASLFKSVTEQTSFFMQVYPGKSNNHGCVITFLTPLSDMPLELLSFDKLLCPSQKSSATDITLYIDRYKDLLPHKILNSKQWQVAWLLIAGMSYRRISEFLEITPQAVEYRTKQIYKTLMIFDAESLRTVAKKYGWINYAPEKTFDSLTHINIF
ncbi:helix-turn-helix transcriptional regulator [Klebsiella aerogenes]|uniref:helix-turn-helix transcriptional regulator n=1 Tax=Klebsiella aerogenes TaxID=548 RepID=UPI000DA1F72B|nr:hypothetical protein [Klebsiella aerogenes]HCB2859855.1 hypothetical protein [Klebsiella aerogenes]HCB2864858.1 hypothetical protein [Klebsiella aerogenes]HCB2880470.1 hypothetical protein [Klebsiella aerogenes]HCB3345921.1 hypothetical protein [Klebsiella aerogenes]HCM1811923.1 hypothetical protein [Klebsiella aerogenes]